MYPQIYDTTYDELPDDEMPDDVMMQNYDTTYTLDGGDSESDEEDEQPLEKSEPKTLVMALRDELKRIEPDRGSLLFRYQGKDYEGVPMMEINANKFVFKLIPSNTLKTFALSEIRLKGNPPDSALR